MTKEINGLSVDVDAEGYLADPKQWTKELATGLAKEEGIELSDQHWAIIEFIRKDGAENGTAPNIRRITKIGGFPTKELYNLFPGGPAKKAAKIAGYQKPHGCI